MFGLAPDIQVEIRKLYLTWIPGSRCARPRMTFFVTAGYVLVEGFSP